MLCISMLAVRRPATVLHLFFVNPPISELLLKKWPAYIVRTMQLSGSVVIQNLLEYSRMTIKEELDFFRVVVDSLRDILDDPV